MGFVSMSSRCCSSSLGKTKSIQGFDSQVYTSSNLRWKPCCRCGDIVVFHVTWTSRNYGKLFWDCPHFKVSFNGKSRLCRNYGINSCKSSTYNLICWFLNLYIDSIKMSVASFTSYIKKLEMKMINSWWSKKVGWKSRQKKMRKQNWLII